MYRSCTARFNRLQPCTDHARQGSIGYNHVQIMHGKVQSITTMYRSCMARFNRLQPMYKSCTAWFNRLQPCTDHTWQGSIGYNHVQIMHGKVQSVTTMYRSCMARFNRLQPCTDHAWQGSIGYNHVQIMHGKVQFTSSLNFVGLVD
jgi:hypothetical protein